MLFRSGGSVIYGSPAKFISSALGAVSPVSNSLLFWGTLLLFSERSFRSSDGHTSRHGGPLPPVVSPEVGVGGPPHSRSLCPRSNPCNFRAWWVVRITKWRPLPLGGSWPCGLLISRFLETPSILVGWGGWSMPGGHSCIVPFQVVPVFALILQGRFALDQECKGQRV